MKNKLLTSLLLFVLLFSSCSKDRISAKLIGKWKLIERFDGNIMGGDFKWHAVAANSTILYFSKDHQYSKTDFLGITCQGSYEVLSDDEIFIRSDCDPNTELIKISELSNDFLIVDVSYFEGVDRYKYKLVP